MIVAIKPLKRKNELCGIGMHLVGCKGPSDIVNVSASRGFTGQLIAAADCRKAAIRMLCPHQASNGGTQTYLACPPVSIVRRE